MWCLRVIKLVVDDLWLRKPCCWGTKMFLKSGVILSNHVTLHDLMYEASEQILNSA